MKVGEWRLSRAKHASTTILESWDAKANPRKSYEWQVSLACARQLVNLNDAADAYTTCDAWVNVVAEPVSQRGIVAKRDIPPKECVMVPLTTNVCYAMLCWAIIYAVLWPRTPHAEKKVAAAQSIGGMSRFATMPR